MLRMAAVVKWTNLDSCMPRGSKDYEVNQLLCGKGIPREDEGFESGQTNDDMDPDEHVSDADE